MKSLTVLELTDCVPIGQVSIQNMAFLAHCIALYNPHVAFIVDKCSAVAAFAEIFRQSGASSHVDSTMQTKRLWM